MVTVIVIIGFSVFISYFGPLDRAPRLRATGRSPDGELLVKVFKQQQSLFPVFRVGIHVRIYDRQNNLLFDKFIFEDGWWHWDVGDMYSSVEFTKDEIHVGPGYSPGDYYAIKRAELK